MTQTLNNAAVELNVYEMAKIELDRQAELYKQACERHADSIGTMGEARMYEDAIRIFNCMEATKVAYSTLGVTGSVGVHFISSQVGA